MLPRHLPPDLANTALEHAGVAIWVVDAGSGTTSFANRRTHEVLQVVPAHVDHLPLWAPSGGVLPFEEHPFRFARANKSTSPPSGCGWHWTTRR